MHVDPQELRREIARHQQRVRDAAWARRYRASSHPHRQRGTRVSERLGELILNLCTNLAEHRYFRGYTYKQDMISEASVSLLKACGKFDLNRKIDGRRASCFGYLTMCAWRAFTNVIERERRRGLRGVGSQPLEVSSLPTLTMGQFDAEGLSERLRERGEGSFWPAAG